MPYDSVVMSAVRSEIRRDLTNGQVTKVYQPSPHEVILHFRVGGGRRLLLFSADPRRFRFHLLQEAPENPAAPPQFCMLLRKHLEGAKLASVEQHGLERTARFRFERSDGHRILVAEMMGKHSNLILLNEEGRILDAVKHVSRRVNRYREVLPSRPYAPPPPPAHPDPISLTPEETTEALRRSGEALTPQTLVKSLANIGPLLAREILARAESPDPASVAAEVHGFMRKVREGQFAPVLLTDGEGRPEDSWAFECRSIPADRQDPAPSMSLALEIGQQFRDRQTGLEALRSEARERLTAVMERGRNRLRELRDAREQAERADEYRKLGETLQASAHLVERGQTEALLTDYYDPEMKPVRIPLDPLLSPQENAEAYFRRHRKARSGLPHLLVQAEEAERNLGEWRRALEEIPTAGEDRLKAILDRIARTHGHESGGGADGKDEPRKPAPGVRRTRSSDGYEIYYGENREGNDTLTTKIAAPTDIWLHVRAGASAHVVIRTQKRPEAVPQRTLMEAAQVAAAHSESKHSTVVPVDYTLRKYVRKPRGSGPGQALYTHEKTLHVEREP